MPVDFGKEYGPLPLGAWIAVVGGSLGIALYANRNKADTGPIVVEDTRAQSGVGQGFDGYIPAVNLGNTVQTPAEPVTNEEWGRAAINYLIAQNYDAALADTAIRKYLAADPLSAAEYALVRIALVKLGSPPIPLPPPAEPVATVKPIVQTPTPVVKPPVPAPRPAPPMRIIVVEPWRAGRSTLWGMAKEFYGDGNKWRRIYDANRKGTTRPDGSPGFISNPDYLRPGDRVYVPY